MAGTNPFLQTSAGQAKKVGFEFGPTLEEERERLVPVIKEIRQEIDALIQRVPRSYGERLKVSNAIWVNAFPVQEARDQVRNNLTNAKMWAGKMLEFLGNPFPAELADKANVQ